MLAQTIVSVNSDKGQKVPPLSKFMPDWDAGDDDGDGSLGGDD